MKIKCQNQQSMLIEQYIFLYDGIFFKKYHVLSTMRWKFFKTGIEYISVRLRFWKYNNHYFLYQLSIEYYYFIRKCVKYKRLALLIQSVLLHLFQWHNCWWQLFNLNTIESHIIEIFACPFLPVAVGIVALNLIFRRISSSRVTLIASLLSFSWFPVCPSSVFCGHWFV